MRQAMFCVLLWLALAATPACTLFSGNSRVLVTSEPPGAEILLDGRETGKTTPALVPLGALIGFNHSITVRKKGFEPEKRDVTHWTTGSTSKWIDGATDNISLITLPLFWTLSNLAFPFQVRWQYVPQELYVRLHPVGEAPVSVEQLVAAKR